MKLKAGRQVIELIKLCYASNTPCLLSGTHGTAKSALLEQSSKEMGISFLTLDLSLLEAVDLQGIPTVSGGVTVYNPPALLPREGRGLLSLEEINRAPAEVRAPALLLLSARKLNGYTLPPGWLPVGSINPSGESYEVHELDPALLSRFVNVSVEADAREWLKWAEANAIHPAVQKFVGSTPNIFDSSNPRGWSYVSSILSSHERGGGEDCDVLLATVAGLVGDVLAAGFVQSYLSDDEALSAAAVLDEYPKNRSTLRRFLRTKRMDLVASSVHFLRVALQSTETATRIRKSQAQQDNLGQFIRDLPPDFRKGVAASARESGALK